MVKWLTDEEVALMLVVPGEELNTRQDENGQLLATLQPNQQVIAGQETPL